MSNKDTIHAMEERKMGMEHLPDPSELKSEMPESTAEFHSYAEIEKRKTMTQEERERIKRLAPLNIGHPLVEGMRPGKTVLTAEGKIEKRVLPPLEEWEDEELENMTILDKEEFYDHVTRCKKCGTEFIAFLNDEAIRKFCPGCGKELE